MPTLNKTKQETQKIFKWGGIAFLIVFLFFMGIKALMFLNTLFAPPPPPQAAFGKLPAIPFPAQTKENILYTLDTLTGYLPNFPDRVKVYKIISDSPTLLSLDKAKEKVSKIDFTSNGVQVAEDAYQWIDSNTSLQRTITMNIFSFDFSLSSPYLVWPTLKTFSNPDEINNSINMAKSFLTDMNLLPEDIDEEKNKITSYSILNGALIPTTKNSDTKIVKVDLFQKDIDQLPIYYQRGVSSTLSFLIGKEEDEPRIVDARYFHKKISDASSTYAIKTSSQAFSELKKGKAHIAYKPIDKVEFKIKKVFLAYYIGESPQEFLMPVIVFEGNNNFIAYVSAVKDEWINN